MALRCWSPPRCVGSPPPCPPVSLVRRQPVGRLPQGLGSGLQPLRAQPGHHAAGRAGHPRVGRRDAGNAQRWAQGWHCLPLPGAAWAHPCSASPAAAPPPAPLQPLLQPCPVPRIAQCIHAVPSAPPVCPPPPPLCPPAHPPVSAAQCQSIPAVSAASPRCSPTAIIASLPSPVPCLTPEQSLLHPCHPGSPMHPPHPQCIPPTPVMPAISAASPQRSPTFSVAFPHAPLPYLCHPAGISLPVLSLPSCSPTVPLQPQCSSAAVPSRPWCSPTGPFASPGAPQLSLCIFPAHPSPSPPHPPVPPGYSACPSRIQPPPPTPQGTTLPPHVFLVPWCQGSPPCPATPTPPQSISPLCLAQRPPSQLQLYASVSPSPG